MEKTKEVLHTQGEWIMQQISDKFLIRTDWRDAIDHNGKGIKGFTRIAVVDGGTLKEAQANAELICKAVNSYQSLIEETNKVVSDSIDFRAKIDELRQERQRLIDSNRELLEALEYAHNKLTNEIGIEYGLGDLSHIHTKLHRIIKEHKAKENQYSEQQYPDF